MPNKTPTALIIGKSRTFENYSGISNRVEEIRLFLNDLGFETEYLAHGDIPTSHSYDVICISSFVIARDLIRYERYTNFMWLDAMDSWKLTRLSLFRENPMKEFIKVARDYAGSRYFGKAHLLTYCSIRDAERDKQNILQPYIFGPGHVKNFEMQDYGPRYVFVGPSKYYPNRVAFEYLISLAKEGIFEKNSLHVYGEPNRYLSKLPGVQIHGEAPDTEVYGSRDIHLVPLWKGAGIKYKTLVPLSQGLKVISSLEGANGLNPSINLLIAKDQNHFKELLQTSNFLDKPEVPTSQLIFLDQRNEVRKILAEIIRKS